LPHPGLFQYGKQKRAFRFRTKILAKKYATQAELDKIEDDIIAEVNASVEFAENSPYPDASELFKDVYVEDNYPYIMD
jgi:pyruvate dehydrogenase E1 component alpha subunit